VPYAEATTQSARTETGSTLTTATKQERSEDCFAADAITDLESLETAQSLCGEQPPILRKALISKPSIFGFGLNLQQCNEMVFVGLSDSWEQFYQAVRRCWRFGQTRPVTVHIICADTEGAVLENIRRKEAQQRELKAEMISVMREQTLAQLGMARQEKTEYQPSVNMELPAWVA